MKKLNKAQAQALFEEHAILIGGRDAIPEETAVELFGEEAVEHAHTLNGQSYELCNVYGIGHYQQGYLTLQDFLTACSYSNFHELEREDIKKIAALMLRDVAKRLEPQGIVLDIGEDAVELLAAEGYDSIYGARPLRRAIQRMVEDALSDEILLGKSAWAEG